MPPARREKGDRELAPRPPPGPPGLLGSVFAPGSASSRRKRPLGVAAPGVCRGSGTVSRHAVAGVGPRGGGGGGVASSGPPGWRPPLPHACGAFPAAVRPRPVPASRPHAPRLSPRRDGRFAPEAECACASAPRGRVPRRRPAGRRGVCPPLRALPPGCGRAAARAPELPPRRRGRWRWRGPGEIGGARCVRRPFGLWAPARAPALSPAPSRVHLSVRPVAAGSCSPPRLGLSLSARRPPPPPPPPTPPPPPPGGATGSRGSVGRSVGVPRVRGEGGRPGAVGRGPPRLPLLGTLLAGSLAPACARALRDATSDQTWRPAEFKHISQRRKRN